MTVEELIDETDRLFGYECDKRCSECNGCLVKDTFNEIKELLEKQIPKKPFRISGIDTNDNAMVDCPICKAGNKTSIKIIKHIYCWKCGQALKWENFYWM